MKILLAVDGSKYSDSAVEVFNNLKLSDTDEIKIISVVDMAFPTAINIYAGYIPASAEIEKTVRENAETIVENAAQKIKNLLCGINVLISTEVLTGSPESRIFQSAEASKSDLIIVGSHGYNRWERLLLGSVSNSVVLHAHCSVLIVRSPK